MTLEATASQVFGGDFLHEHLQIRHLLRLNPLLQILKILLLRPLKVRRKVHSNLLLVLEQSVHEEHYDHTHKTLRQLATHLPVSSCLGQALPSQFEHPREVAAIGTAS